MLSSYRAAATLGAAWIAIAACGKGAPLLDPRPQDLTAAAPDSFRVEFQTSRGPFLVTARRHWAPIGVDRFYYLARHDYFRGARFFRVIEGYVAQFGLSGDTAINRAWRGRRIADEPVLHTNARGTIAFARGGANTRSVQLYINLVDNPRLDTLSGNGVVGFPPVGEVTQGMESAVDSIYKGHRGNPRQDSIRTVGNPYLERAFPELDYIIATRIVREWR